MGREGCEGMDRKAGMELEGRDGMRWEEYDGVGREGWEGRNGKDEIGRE